MLLPAIILLPLVGAVICGLLHARGGEARKLAGPIASLAVFAALVCSVVLFLELDESAIVYEGFTWIAAGKLSIPFKLLFDQLSGFMALIVTGVGFLIHVYSIGYMAHDEGKAKYFAYLNLFIFAMSLLVLGASLPLLFVGWEGVGAMSYLLIGFWYDKEGGWPAQAGQKAFIANRVGDAGFIIGMFLLFQTFGTLDIASIAASPVPAAANLTLICILLFVGATGKSAQIPLFVWLPDAMAGPTPVSALIHAATMVTAGVYMVSRMSFLFAQSAVAMAVVATIGAVTALLAATIALVQRDIKKVLAYSTVSQLGYMFLACGVGAWGAAIFHVGTHAFFKALLFLGAGSVIHGLHDEQDSFKMGGLKKWMPTTFVTFLVGSFALAGFPLTSGWFSKDEILWQTVNFGQSAGTVLWIIGVVTALLTAFYTFRLVALTFFGEPRFDPEQTHPHESPKVMTIPLIILAVLALFGGWMGIPPVIAENANWIHHWLEPPLAQGTEVWTQAHAHAGHEGEGLFMAISSVVAIIGIAVGFVLYRHGPERLAGLTRKLGPAHALLLGKWFIDELYELFILAPLALLSKAAAWFDLHVIDGIVNGVGTACRRLSDLTGRLHSGHLQHYALWMAGGTTVLIAWLILQVWFQG